MKFECYIFGAFITCLKFTIYRKVVFFDDVMSYGHNFEDVLLHSSNTWKLAS